VQSLCSSLLSLSATPTTPPPSLGTSLESLAGSGSLRLPLWDKASAEFCFARSRDLLTKNPICLKPILSDVEVCSDNETETEVPQQEVPQNPEETEHANEYRDCHVICSTFGQLNQLQGARNSVHSAPAINNSHSESDVIQSRAAHFRMKEMRDHMRVLGSKMACGESALNLPKYKRSSESVDTISVVSSIRKQLQDSYGIRKLVPKSQNVLKCSHLNISSQLMSLNGNCLTTDIHHNSNRKQCADDILSEESSHPPSDCSVSSNEDPDLPPVACFDQMLPFSHSCAKPPSPFTDEAVTVFSYQDPTEGSTSPPPVTSFLNSLSPSCVPHKDIVTPFTTFQHGVTDLSQKLTHDRNNSPWLDDPKTSDAPVFGESPQSELELCTSFNLTFSSACTSPDLAEYPELDGDLAGLPPSPTVFSK